MRKLAAAIGLLAIAAVIASACGDAAADRLQQLGSAPMATFELPQATSSTRTEVMGSTGGPGLSDTPSRIVTAHEVQATDLASAFGDTVDAALEAGYATEEQSSDRAYSGSQDVGGQRVTITIIQSAAESKILVTLLTRS